MEINVKDLRGKSVREILTFAIEETETKEEIEVCLSALRKITSKELPSLIADFAEHVWNLAERHSDEPTPTYHEDEEEPPYWPDTIIIPSRYDGKSVRNEKFKHDESALYMVGYRVGKRNGLPEDERRDILTAFFENHLHPKIREIFIDEDGEQEYGEPNSMKRLLKMANVMAANCRNMKRNQEETGDDYSVAIQHYEDDLDFLHDYFFDPMSQGDTPFDWPDTDI